MSPVTELVRRLREIGATVTGTAERGGASARLHGGKVRTYGRWHTPFEVFTEPELTRHWIDSSATDTADRA